MPRCFVVIVHYGDGGVTDQAVASLLNGAVVPESITVVDQGRDPWNAPAHPALHVIRPGENHGYAAGINLGLGTLWSVATQADDLVVVMNNDVAVYPDTIAKLQRWWQLHPTPALIGVVIKEAHSHIYGGGRVQWWTGRAKLETEASPPVSLHYLHGAFWAASYQTLLHLHGVPEHYFLYWEDVLLGERARRQNVPLRVAPMVQVRHRDSLHATPTESQLYYLVRNGALFLEHESPGLWRWYWWLANRLRLVYHTWWARPARAVVRDALRDALRNVTGPRSAYD